MHTHRSRTRQAGMAGTGPTLVADGEAVKSPDCRDGKHKACTFEDAAWDGEREQTEDCGCACHSVQCAVFIGSDQCELERTHDGDHRTTWADKVSVFWKGDEPYSHGKRAEAGEDRSGRDETTNTCVDGGGHILDAQQPLSEDNRNWDSRGTE